MSSVVDREVVAPGVFRHWLHNGGIVVFTLQNVSRETLDAWAKATKECVEQWPVDRPFLNVHNFQPVPNMSFTPYLRQKSGELVQLEPHKVGRTAIVIPKTFIFRAVALFLNRTNTRITVRQRRMFFLETEAVAWAEELMKKGATT